MCFYSLGTAEQVCDASRRNRRLLAAATDMLPRVHPTTGASECPNAKEIFEKKEERAELLHRSIVELEAMSRGAAVEIERLQCELRNLTLDDDDSRHRASQLRIKVERNKRMRIALGQESSFARAAMREAATRAYPGTKPRRW